MVGRMNDVANNHIMRKM